MAVRVGVTRTGTTIDNFTEDEVQTYSYQEDITTVDPGTFDGGIGQITTSIPDRDHSKALMGANITLTDTTAGVAPGVIRSLTVDESQQLQITADTSTTVLNAFVSAGPYNGTLGGVLGYYFALVKLPSPTVVSGITSRSVSYPGFKGNLWDHIKQLCAAEQIEMALVGTTPTFRALYANTYAQDNIVARSWTLDQQQSSKIVRMHYYGNTYNTNGEVYPVPPTPALPEDVASGDATTNDPTVYSVDANQTLVVDIQLSASLDNVNQPTCMDYVPPINYQGTSGAYSVVGNDGLLISAAHWTAAGGSVKVRVTDDPSIIRMTIIGANIAAYAPFSLSSGSGASDNSLHITGSGVFQTDQVVDIYTGAIDTVTGTDIGVEVTNPYIDTISKAIYTGQRTAGAQALTYTISGELASFNSADTAIFGKPVGSLVAYDSAVFRVTETTTSESSVQYSATINTQVSDFNALGLTTAQFNTIWANRTAGDFSVQPLRTAA